MLLSISEIVYKTASLEDRDQKVAFLKANNSEALRTVLTVMYDPTNYVWNIPHETPPPYKPSQYPDSQGMLYRRARILRYLIVGFGGEGLTQYRREQLFIELMETIDKDDALFMIEVLLQRQVKGLTVDVINEALGLKLPDVAQTAQPEVESTTAPKKRGRKPKNV